MRSLVVLCVCGLISVSDSWTCDYKHPTGNYCNMGVNLALNKRTCQSSTYSQNTDDKTYSSDRGVDGIADTNCFAHPCTHTNAEYEPWWMVDLEESYRISTVEIVNRGDCCRERLLGAQIRIGDDPHNNNPVCGTVSDVSSLRLNFSCRGMKGRFLSVVIAGKSAFLTLCEVRAYADCH